MTSKLNIHAVAFTPPTTKPPPAQTTTPAPAPAPPPPSQPVQSAIQPQYRHSQPRYPNRHYQNNSNPHHNYNTPHNNHYDLHYDPNYDHDPYYSTPHPQQFHPPQQPQYAQPPPPPQFQDQYPPQQFPPYSPNHNGYQQRPHRQQNPNYTPRPQQPQQHHQQQHQQQRQYNNTTYRYNNDHQPNPQQHNQPYPNNLQYQQEGHSHDNPLPPFLHQPQPPPHQQTPQQLPLMSPSLQANPFAGLTPVSKAEKTPIIASHFSLNSSSKQTQTPQVTAPQQPSSSSKLTPLHSLLPNSGAVVPPSPSIDADKTDEQKVPQKAPSPHHSAAPTPLAVAPVTPAPEQPAAQVAQQPVQQTVSVVIQVPPPSNDDSIIIVPTTTDSVVISPSAGSTTIKITEEPPPTKSDLVLSLQPSVNTESVKVAEFGIVPLATTPLVQQLSSTSNVKKVKLGETTTLEPAPSAISQKLKKPAATPKPPAPPKKPLSELIPRSHLVRENVYEIDEMNELSEEILKEDMIYSDFGLALITEQFPNISPSAIPVFKTSTNDHVLSHHAKLFQRDKWKKAQSERKLDENGDPILQPSISRSKSRYKNDPNVAKIQMTEAGYKMSKAQGDEKKVGDVQMILNKLSEHNIDKLVKEVQAINLDSMELFQQVIMLLFNKAVNEPNFSAIYAKFCAKLKDLSLSVFEQPQSACPEAAIAAAPQNVTFKKLIVSEVQSSFERNPFTTLSAREVLALPEDEQLVIFLSRKRYLGTIKLLGELYRAGLIGAKHIYMCFDRLVENMKNEEALEALCNLFRTTVFALVDQHFRSNRISAAIDGSYNPDSVQPEIRKLIATFKQSANDKESFAPRMRYMMMDTVDEFNNKLQQAGEVDRSVQEQKKQPQQQLAQHQQQEKLEKEKRVREEKKLKEETRLAAAFSSRSEKSTKGGKGPSKDDDKKSHQAETGKKVEKGGKPAKDDPKKGGSKPVGNDGWNAVSTKSGVVGNKPVQAPPQPVKKSQPKLKQTKSMNNQFAAFGFGGSDEEDEPVEDEDEDEEQEYQEEEEEEENTAKETPDEPVDEEEPYLDDYAFPEVPEYYHFTEDENELLERIEPKFSAVANEFKNTNDPEDVQYSFKSFTPEQLWLVAYQALKGIAQRKIADIDSIYNSGILVHLPPTPDDWNKAILRLAADFNDALEDKPIFSNKVGAYITQLIEANKCTFDKAANKEHFESFIGDIKTEIFFDYICPPTDQ